MKKLLAITLTVIMLMTILPLNSFALFSKLPEVENITFETDDPIYYSELKKELNSILKDAEENEYEPDDEVLIYDICHHLNDYEITLEFKDGTSLTINEDVYVGSDYDVTVWAEVNIFEATVAFETGATTVPVDVYAYIENDYKDYTSDTFTVDFDITECYFKSIEYISGLPEEISEFAHYLELDGYKFKVTYPDGTEKTVVLEDDEDYGFNIDGKYVGHDIDVENRKVIFSCFDAECSADVNIIDYPFYAISIISYSSDFETGMLERIEYEIYMDDDTTESFVCNNIEYIYPDDDAPYAVVGNISGHDIIVRNEREIDQTYPTTIIDYIEIEIDGTEVADYLLSFNEEAESTNPVRAFLTRLINAFYRIVDFLRNLFTR